MRTANTLRIYTTCRIDESKLHFWLRLYWLNKDLNLSVQAHIEEAQGPFGEDLEVEIVTCDSYFQIVIPYESNICHLSRCHLTTGTTRTARKVLQKE